MSETVSFVIVTRNRCDSVLRCLASVEAQDYPNREIVVVDNGSTDDTLESVRHRFPLVRLVPLARNEGVPAARNRGMKAARGGICIMIDDDARLAEPDAASRAIARLSRDARLACVSFRILDGETGRDALKTVPLARKRVLKDDTPIAYFCGAGFAIRKTSFIEAGRFWEPLEYAGEELDLSCRLLSAGFRLSYAASIPVAHDEIPAGRPRGQWIYHQARNRLWVAARNLPWPYVLTTVLLWWSYLAGKSLLSGERRFFLQGARDGLAGLPRVLKDRRPVTPEIAAEIRRLSGRLWY